MSSRPVLFGLFCEANDIEHLLTKPNHSWTNRQVERMNRTIKDATVKCSRKNDYNQLHAHLADLVEACKLTRRLSAL